MIGVAPGTAVAPTWRADRPLPSVEVHPDRVEEAFRAVAADLTALADRARAEGRQAAAEIVATGALIATDPGLVAAARRATTADGIHEAVEAYQAAVDAGDELAGATRAAAEAAVRGLAGTVPMQARKGRASYLGPRTIGHEDPGAASTVLILQALATVTA